MSGGTKCPVCGWAFFYAAVAAEHFPCCSVVCKEEHRKREAAVTKSRRRAMRMKPAEAAEPPPPAPEPEVFVSLQDRIAEEARVAYFKRRGLPVPPRGK